MADYLRDPAAIYCESFARVRAETNLSSLPVALHEVAVRLVHACGMPEITADLAWSPTVLPAARTALAIGAPILVDVQMVACGIRPHGNRVLCTLHDPVVTSLARRLGTTRSAAAVTLWREWLAGAVVAIGNAPTALFYLLEWLAAGGPRPAAILGFPVGFVSAVEAKEALIDQAGDIPYLTLRGRCGGSAIAAAAVNALLGGVGQSVPIKG
ncbi:Cobalt-precorrin-8x methylmutase [invertebrate metagenome]|uniref:Cobalt-precorrin-8x methylmutase n=1 Tax=invertebrate metagenome TaxID=1711999 RepID=A0A484H7Y8_9ZZZZ